MSVLQPCGERQEGVSPAYLISNVLGLYPELSVKRIEAQEEVLEKLELPGNCSLDSFLTGLSDAAAGHPTPLFAELYSWYLKSPVYCETVKRLVEAAFLQSRGRSPAKASEGAVRRNFPFTARLV